MRIYVAGPITGRPRYRDEFAEAAGRLTAIGWEVANPASLTTPTSARPGDTAWMAWMRTTAHMLADCDAVALLPGWRDSAGATIEADWARAIGLPVASLQDWLDAASLRDWLDDHTTTNPQENI